jgi:hypothetical protein
VASPSARIRAYLAALPPVTRKGLAVIRNALVRAHAADVKGYTTSKGTIRFPLSEPPPLDVVTLLVRARIAELSAE